MAKPNKENIITEMLVELKTGISYSQCRSTVGLKWKLPQGTFVRYWKEANSRHQINQEAQQKKISEASIKITQKTFKAINKKLLAIINNEIIVEEKAYDMQLRKVVVYQRELSPMEIIEAIKEYNRINGL